MYSFFSIFHGGGIINLDGRTEIFGRKRVEEMRSSKKGCGYLGKIVSYPGNKYEEMGSVHIDLTSPHCMLVLGKRGSGKSYTLGVMIESFAELEEDVKERISLIVVDTMSAFHGLKTENCNAFEAERLNDFNGLSPTDYEDDIDIFMPKLSIEKYSEDEKPDYDHLIQFPLKDVDATEWLSLFDLEPTEPTGILLWDVLDELKKDQKHFHFQDIYDKLEDKGENGLALKNFFRQIEELDIFTEKKSSFKELTTGGNISVLDMSYLGRLKGYDVRNLLLSIIGKKLLQKRTLYSTLEMQAKAGMIDDELKSKVSDNPLIYMMIDEAHLFLPKDRKTLSSDVLLDWVKLGRHPGLSLIMATQEPSAIHESAIRQSDIIMSHNLTSHDDIEALEKARQ
ncbi:MAG: ATP-binding protein, partial [Thermoplasmatota archaeon]